MYLWTLLNLLSAFGMTYVVVSSKIFLPVRNLLIGYTSTSILEEDYVSVPILNRKAYHKMFFILLSCYACSGFWCSMLSSLLFVTLGPSSFNVSESLYYVISMSFAGSMFCYTSDTLLKKLES